MLKLKVKAGKNNCRVCGEQLKKGKTSDHESCTTALLTGVVESPTERKFNLTIHPQFDIIIKWIKYNPEEKQNMYDLTFRYEGQELKIEGGHEKSLIKLGKELGKDIRNVIKGIKKDLKKG